MEESAPNTSHYELYGTNLYNYVRLMNQCILPDLLVTQELVCTFIFGFVAKSPFCTIIIYNRWPSDKANHIVVKIKLLSHLQCMLLLICLCTFYSQQVDSV